MKMRLPHPLWILSLARNGIGDIGFLSGFANEVSYLVLSDNEITDVTLLGEFTCLMDGLNLKNNSISDLAPLALNPYLYVYLLDISENVYNCKDDEVLSYIEMLEDMSVEFSHDC